MNRFLTVLFLSLGCWLQARPLTIVNESNVSIDVILWKDSKIIFHHIMKPNDEVTAEMGTGLLLQYQLVDVDMKQFKFGKSKCEHFKLLPNDYIETKLTESHLSLHTKWWLPNISVFSICYNITFIEQRA